VLRWWLRIVVRAALPIPSVAAERHGVIVALAALLPVAVALAFGHQFIGSSFPSR